MTRTVQHDVNWLLDNHDHGDAFEVACARQIRRLLDSNAELERTLLLARDQLASHLQEMVYSEIGQDGQVHDRDALLIIESEQDLINQIDEALDRAMAGTAQVDA